MKSVLTTFQVKWSILADGLPIQLNPPQKPGSDPLTTGTAPDFKNAFVFHNMYTCFLQGAVVQGDDTAVLGRHFRVSPQLRYETSVER